MGDGDEGILVGCSCLDFGVVYYYPLIYIECKTILVHTCESQGLSVSDPISDTQSSDHFFFSKKKLFLIPLETFQCRPCI